MTDYLPAAYLGFRTDQPQLAAALDELAAAADASGPLSERERRLVKLGIAIGRESDGAMRSNVRKAFTAGMTVDEIRQIAALPITTAGFPPAIAALQRIDEVLAAAGQGTITGGV